MRSVAVVATFGIRAFVLGRQLCNESSLAELTKSKKKLSGARGGAHEGIGTTTSDEVRLNKVEINGTELCFKHAPQQNRIKRVKVDNRVSVSVIMGRI